MPDQAAGWALAALAGALLGLLYFGGLWWTVRRVMVVKHPIVLVAGSFLVRAALAGGALLLIMDGDIVRLLVALGAFLFVRGIVLWRVRAAAPGPGVAAGRKE
jgi:F1F0 ATPase subunit 2